MRNVLVVEFSRRRGSIDSRSARGRAHRMYHSSLAGGTFNCGTEDGEGEDAADGMIDMPLTVPYLPAMGNDYLRAQMALFYEKSDVMNGCMEVRGSPI